MRLGSYIRSRVPELLVLVALELLLALVLRISGMGADFVAFVCSIVLVSAVVAVALGFARERGFWDSLSETCSSLDNARLLPELIDRPEFPEGQAAYDALVSVAKSANDEVAEQRRFVGEYRAYVETWVHEAKSPITAARLALSNLEEDADACAGCPRELEPVVPRLRSVEDELARVERYVEQALFYARSETLERDFLVRSHSLREMVASAIKANANLLIAAGVTPRLGEGLDLKVFTDDKWLVFMLGQLLQNTARYVRPGCEGWPQVWFDARLLDEGLANERVELTVRDNGCGVSAADLPRVLERGFTGDNGRTHKQSTGLGLWLVARLARKMGVSVSVDSAEDEFFSVTFAFPANKMHYFED